MKFKHLLLSVSCAAVALGASAQSHHGFYLKPDQNMLDNWYETSSTPKSFCVYFDTDFAMPVINADGSVVESSIYTGSATDMLTRENIKDKYTDKLHGAIVEATLENGKLIVTVPSQTQYPSVANITAPGTIVFHLCMGGAPARINDPGNELSATGDEAMLKGCTGMRIGIKAPAGATVKGYISSPNSKQLFKDEACTVKYDNVTNNVVRTAIFDFDNVPANQYAEINSGAPYNSDAIMQPVYQYTNKTGKLWENGFCAKYFDLAVSNVKPGDVIEFTGVQTLHDGWNPIEFAGVEGVGIDANADAPVEYYNLQGIRVENPTSGLYISRQGDKVTKVIL